MRLPSVRPWASRRTTASTTMSAPPAWFTRAAASTPMSNAFATAAGSKIVTEAPPASHVSRSHKVASHEGVSIYSCYRRPTPPAGHDNHNRLQANSESAAGGQMPPPLIAPEGRHISPKRNHIIHYINKLLQSEGGTLTRSA